MGLRSLCAHNDEQSIGDLGIQSLHVPLGAYRLASRRGSGVDCAVSAAYEMDPGRFSSLCAVQALWEVAALLIVVVRFT